MTSERHFWSSENLSSLVFKKGVWQGQKLAQQWKCGWLGGTLSQAEVECTVVCQVLIDWIVPADHPWLSSTFCYQVKTSFRGTVWLNQEEDQGLGSDVYCWPSFSCQAVLFWSYMAIGIFWLYSSVVVCVCLCVRVSTALLMPVNVELRGWSVITVILLIMVRPNAF